MVSLNCSLARDLSSQLRWGSGDCHHSKLSNEGLIILGHKIVAVCVLLMSLGPLHFSVLQLNSRCQRLHLFPPKRLFRSWRRSLCKAGWELLPPKGWWYIKSEVPFSHVGLLWSVCTVSWGLPTGWSSSWITVVTGLITCVLYSLPFLISGTSALPSWCCLYFPNKLPTLESSFPGTFLGAPNLRP